MLQEINIKNLGVIAQTTMPLGPGFTAITGETGAGKTMLITALGLLMGSRADAQLVRTGAENARVSGTVSLKNIKAVQEITEIVGDAGGEIEADELLIGRTVFADNPSKANVGGVRAPASVLSNLAENLFCVHGQTEQLRLRSQTQQRQTLDRFGGKEIAKALEEYRQSFTQYSALRSQLTEITENREARRREAERLRQEIAQIEAVNPAADEIELLQNDIERLSNAEQMRIALTTAVNFLQGDTSSSYDMAADVLLAQAAAAVAQVGSYDENLAANAAELNDIAIQVQSIAANLLRGLEDLDTNSVAELENAQQRLADLRQLERNYGPELSDVLGYYEQANAKLLTLDDDDSRVESLREQSAHAYEKWRTAAQTLSTARKKAAAELSARVTAEIKALALPETVLQIEVKQLSEPAKHGNDEIDFLLIPHPGAAPRPLAKAASGGELSRIMLALEVVLAEVWPVPTFVFDEIDAGIGGAAAIEVGRRLAKLAETSQVIVVTHLAQVAAFASNHLRVVKDRQGEFTASSCQKLVGDDRLAEIARLLSGLSDSTSALEHGAELLELAGQSID